MPGPRGRSSGRNVYRGVVRTCQLSKYYGVTECVCAFRLVLKNVVLHTQRERERERERERAREREGERVNERGKEG